MTEPVFDWVREHLPVYIGGLDLSPIVVIIAAEFVQRMLGMRRHDEFELHERISRESRGHGG